MPKKKKVKKTKKLRLKNKGKIAPKLAEKKKQQYLAQMKNQR